MSYLDNDFYRKTMKNKSGKSFFDYSTKEKKAIVSEAAKESNKVQKEYMDTHQPIEWEALFDNKFAMNEDIELSYVYEKKIKDFFRSLLASQRTRIIERLGKKKYSKKIIDETPFDRGAGEMIVFNRLITDVIEIIKEE